MNAAAPRRTIPIARAGGTDACAGAECFALMVLGDSMAPEFEAGDVIVVEPEGLAIDGSYVLACVAGEWMLRRLVASDGRWTLVALKPNEPPVAIDGLEVVRGVVIQKSRPGRRRDATFYGPAGETRETPSSPSLQRSIRLPTE